MNEELMIKVKVDTSSISTSINKIKNEVSNVNNSINSTTQASSASKQVANQASQATGQLSQHIQKLVQGIQKLKNVGSVLDLAEMGTELGVAHVQTKAISKSMEVVEDTVEDTSKTMEKLAKDIKEAVKQSQLLAIAYRDAEVEAQAMLNPKSHIYTGKAAYTDWAGEEDAMGSYNLHMADVVAPAKAEWIKAINRVDMLKMAFADAEAEAESMSEIMTEVATDTADGGEEATNAWKKFNDYLVQAIAPAANKLGDQLLKVRDAIDNLPTTPTQLVNSLKAMAKNAKEVVSTKLWDFMFKARLSFGVAEVSIKKFISNGLEKIKNFKLPSLKDIGNSFSKLGGSIKNLASGGLTKVANGLKGIGSGATASAGAVAAAGTALLGFVAALVAFTAAGVAAALSVSKLGNEIYNSANKFGFSTKAYQEWSYIMERTGSSVEDLKGFLETLGSEQGAVITGSKEAAQKFKNLGISAEEAAGMDSQQLFETTITKLQGIEDATTRSAYAYELFGDEASRLMNVINMSNGEMQEAINNYHLLGGSMSGELIEKSNSLQGSISSMKQAWQGVANTMAEVFIPVVQAVVRWLTKAFVWVNLFLRTIFGLDLKSSAASDSMDKNTSSTKKYTGGLKSATKAAEELKRTTMGFDELNIVQDPNKSSGSTGDTGSSAGAGLGNLPALDDSMLNMDDLNLDSMYAWFEKYKGVIAQITTWSLILIGVILAVIGICSVNIPLAILGIGMAGLGIAVGIKSGAFEEAWNAISGALKKAGEAIGKVFSTIGEAIANFFVGIWDGLVNFGTSAWNWLVGAWNSTVSFIAGIPGWIWDKILVPIGNFFVKLGKGIVDGVVNAINGIKKIFSTIGTWIKDNIITPVGKFFSGMWNGFKDGASKAWNGIKSVFSVVTTWFKDKFSAAWNAVKNIFSTGGKIFDGIKDGIASTFKTVVNGIIGGINKVIKVPFDAINGMLNKIRNISVAGVEPFKDLWKKNPLSVPQIPKLATGGITTGATLAQIGEAGREAVLPLENNTGWMDALADKIAERNSSPTKVVLQVGEKELGWATINSINNITKQTGGIQLAL